MSESSLDDARLKELDELTDDDKKTLQEHKDDLTDDELETFKDVLGEEKGGEEEEEEEGGEEGGEPTFKTQEEIDEYIDQKWKEKEDTRTQKEEKDEGEEKEPEIFTKKYKPAGWSGFAKDLVSTMREMDKKEKEKFSRELKEINKEFDAEIENLRKGGEDIPKKGSKERGEFDRELAKIGMKFKGVTSMGEAYEIYKVTKSKISSKGEKKEEEGDEGEEGEEGKGKDKTARRVAGGSGGGTPPKGKERKYKDVATRTLDDATDAAIKKFKDLS